MNLLDEMASDDQPQNTPAPFDEQTAAENLARVQRELEESRQRRKDASAAFDKFVSSFRKGSAEGAATATPLAEYRSRSSMRVQTPPLPSTPRPKPRNATPRLGLIAGGVVALAAGLLLMRAWRGPSPEQSSAPPAAAHAPAVATQASPSSAPRESAAISSAAPAELIAIRDVWVRATVDGQRVLERELEAGTRVPLRGRTIVIRAGNAGAVRMVVDGQDRGTLGGEGVVLTRTYTSTTAQ